MAASSVALTGQLTRAARALGAMFIIDGAGVRGLGAKRSMWAFITKSDPTD